MEILLNRYLSMKCLSLSFLALWLCAACFRPSKEDDIAANESLLLQLDTLITRKEDFVREKEARIQRLKEKEQGKLSAEQLYDLNRRLYWEYRVYNSDSALKYVQQNFEMALRRHNVQWEATSRLDLSFIYTANGLLNEALDIVKPLQTDQLSREMRSRYYGQMRTLYSRLQLYSSGNEQLSRHYCELYERYSDSTYQTASPDEPRYWYARVWKYQNTDSIDHIRQQLEKLEGQLSQDSRNYSILAYHLADIYRKKGNTAEWLKYMVYSGLSDIKGANRDIGSIQSLAQYFYEHGDLDRAYAYISYCQEIAVAYGSRVRLWHLSQLQNDIQQTYIRRDHEQQKRLKLFLVAISVLSVILIAAFLFIWQQVKKRTRANRKLDEANRMLRSLNEQLRQVNLLLRDANYIKEEYIGYVFNLCSAYISKMKEFRKNINRKLKVGQLEDIQRLTSTSSIDTNELKEFYQSFDSIFLHLFPRFVEELNGLLRPEERIETKPDELTTELRIYALIRLGITDSVKISEFLHCSLQTVYNNRSRTTAKSRLPKEEFMNAVKELGKRNE